ncbi:MFS transporter [Trebonia kvetii]|nr:MFS transporter [Trebonia kvetii]
MSADMANRAGASGERNTPDTPGTADAEGLPRRRFLPPLLRDVTFRRYWTGATVSMVGDQVTSIAVPLTAVLALHSGAAAMGFLTALQWLPSLLFGMHAGAWADRRGRRRQLMIACDLGRFVLLGTVPVCWALGVLTLGQLLAVVFAAGTLSILFDVANATLFVSIVRREQYVDGQSLLYGSRAMSFLLGPSLGGLLAQLLTAPFALVADALSFLGSAFFLRRIDPSEPPADTGTGGVTQGLRFIVRSPIVRASLIGVAVVNFFNLMFFALVTLYAVRVLHVSAGLLGLILGCGATGGLLGAWLTKAIAARIGVGMAYVAGCFGFTAPLALVPLAPVPAGHGTDWAVVGLLFGAEFLSGFGVMVLDISIGSIFAAVIPDAVRSRVTGAFTAINYGTRPAGALLGGLLGAALGLHTALWIAVIGGVAGAALLVPSPLPRFRMPEGFAAAAQ